MSLTGVNIRGIILLVTYARRSPHVLTIKKHPLSMKAATLGTIAFIIGLSGTALYIDRLQQHENLAFGREETVLGTSDSRSAEQKSSAKEAQNATSTQQTGSPQTAGGGASTTLPAPTSAGSASVATAPTSTSTATSPSIEPGRGAGGATTSPTPSSGSGSTSAEPANDLPLECLLQNCVTTTLQNTTNGLLNP